MVPRLGGFLQTTRRERGIPWAEMDEDFWKPLWKRIGVVVLGAVWAAIELHRGSVVWAVLAAALVGLSVWEFFLRQEGS